MVEQTLRNAAPLSQHRHRRARIAQLCERISRNIKNGVALQRMSRRRSTRHAVDSIGASSGRSQAARSRERGTNARARAIRPQQMTNTFLAPTTSGQSLRAHYLLCRLFIFSCCNYRPAVARAQKLLMIALRSLDQVTRPRRARMSAPDAPRPCQISVVLQENSEFRCWLCRIPYGR